MFSCVYFKASRLKIKLTQTQKFTKQLTLVLPQYLFRNVTVCQLLHKLTAISNSHKLQKHIQYIFTKRLKK